MEDLQLVKVLVAELDFHLEPHEIALFRGAVIASMGEHADILFHNHKDDTQYRYAYPLVQYKCIDHKASIVCINEGTGGLGQFLSKAVQRLQLGSRTVKITKYQVFPNQVPMRINPDLCSYRISQWMPLNPENYERYKLLGSLSGKVQLLENILKGNILSMCKGMGVQIEEELIVNITSLSNPKQIPHKDVAMMSFNADFTCNLSMPSYIGLGKNASVGFGMIKRI